MGVRLLLFFYFFKHFFLFFKIFFLVQLVSSLIPKNFQTLWPLPQKFLGIRDQLNFYFPWLCIRNSNYLLFQGGTTLIQGAMFIVFAKWSRGFVYSRGYVYSGVQNSMYPSKVIVICWNTNSDWLQKEPNMTFSRLCIFCIFFFKDILRLEFILL